MNTITSTSSSLEQKIVEALTNETISSCDLGNLLTKTETAITTADADAKIAEATALDPLQSPNLALARATLEDARFKVDRLRSLLPRLQTRFEQVADKETYEKWIVRYDALRPQHDALAAELKTTYAAAVAKLVPLLSRTVQLNSEISRLNQSAPSGVRGSDGGWLTAISTPSDLVLPNPDKPSVMAWPLPSNIDWSAVTPIFRSPGDEWWKTQQAEGARARIEDAKRADALQEEEGCVRNDPKLWRRG